VSTPAASPHLARRAARSAPRPVAGRYRRTKTVLAVAMLGFFVLVPWLRWDRGPDLPDQAVLFDIGARRLFLFGIELWPQDLPLVVLLLVGGAAALFGATAVNGRVWCGFACPQTVWTDLFFAIERRLGRLAPALRHPVFILVGVVTGIAFAGWFTDAPALPAALLTGRADAAAYVTVLVLTLTTWLLGGVVREKVCLNMCPWPRFQAALLDPATRLVAYDDARGEPRGRARLPLRADLGGAGGDGARGDCIDCGRCVAVCPTLVDIRDGLQMGCIGCGLCADACDAVMAKIDRPRGLVRFAADDPAPAILRPKPLIYGAVVLACAGIFLWMLLDRTLMTVTVEQARGRPFVQLSDGSVRNDMLVSLASRRPGLAAVRLSLAEHPEAHLAIAAGAPPVLEFAADHRAEERLFITFAPGHAPRGNQPATLVIQDAASGAALERVPIHLNGPAP
jgi:cytochrome c oxidase accessory protein FixG